MASPENTWIWQQAQWPEFHWDDRAVLDMLLKNIITSSAIEGEALNAASVRSSLAKRLGVVADQAYPTSSRSEGLAKMVLDAVDGLDEELTVDRLFQWHSWLFPDDVFSLAEISIGQLRGDEPMQVVSGRIDRPTIHFEAPAQAVLQDELAGFIRWFNQSQYDAVLDPLLRAALCHLWLITLHPFDDGNGRITRALTDRALA